MKTEHRDNAVVFVADRDMFLPGIVAADEAASQPGSDRYDVVFVADQGCVPPEFHDWHERRGKPFSLIEIDLTATFPDEAILTRRFPQSAIFKLQLPDLFGDRYQRILYVDADTEVARPVDPLFDLDMDGCTVAATDDLTTASMRDGGNLQCDRTQFLLREAGFGPSGNRRYASSGVILIDVEEWRRQSMSDRALRFLVDHYRLCIFPDQDALNAALPSTYCLLSPYWNFRTDIEAFGPLRPYLVDPAILHFVSHSKPWIADLWDGDQDAVERYRRYFADTPWPDGPPRPEWADHIDEHDAVNNRPESLLRRSGRTIERAIRHTRKRTMAALKGETYDPSRRSERYQRNVELYFRTTPFADIVQNLIPPFGEEADARQSADFFAAKPSTECPLTE